jgi:hypothetical protein
MNNQINELSKGEDTHSSPRRYNLRSKKKEGKYDIPNQRSRAEKPAKDATNNNKDTKTQNLSPLAKGLVREVKEILKPPSSFNFEHEIEKIRIPVPLLELVKHEDFKISLSKIL